MKDSYVFYKDKLGKEYLEAFGWIELYVQSQNVDDAVQEERLGELLDIFLSTEAAGKPVQKIVGNDLERFCKTFCSDFSWKNRVLSVVDRLKSIVWLLLVVSALDMTIFVEDTIESGGGDFWRGDTSIDMSAYLIGIFVTWGLVAIFNFLLSCLMFKRKKISMKVLRAASIGMAFLTQSSTSELCWQSNVRLCFGSPRYQKAE